MKATLFYNHQLGDLLLIEFNIDKYPTHYQKENDIVLIYNDEELIGINIFNISSICKMKMNGQIHLPPKILIQLLNSILSKYNVIIDFQDKSLFSVGNVNSCQECENYYIVNVNVGNKMINAKSKKIIEKNNKCVVAFVGAILSNGYQVKNEMCNDILIEGYICSYCDLSINDDNNLLLLNDDIEVGQDFFSY